jgi:glycosyltransferase involved in cell wall biosynthesis
MEQATVAAWLAQADGGWPYVASLHTFESDYLRLVYPDSARYQAEHEAFSNACNAAARVIFPSNGCRDDLVAHFDVAAERVISIGNPVSCARVRRLSLVRDPDTVEWVRSQPVFRLVHVGRLWVEKNHLLLFQACAELAKRKRQFHLVCVGEGLGRAQTEKMIRDLGIQKFVTLAGAKDNPYPWIAAADALVLTSILEAFALVLVEAMACGTPVVSVDCPAGPREVLAGGEFGLLVPNNDATAIASALERLMDDASLREQLIAGGIRRAAEYDVSKIVREWERLIDALPPARRQ